VLQTSPSVDITNVVLEEGAMRNGSFVAVGRVLTALALCAVGSSSVSATTINLYDSFGTPPPIGAPPGTFGHETLTLNESSWHVGSLGGPNPTVSQFLSVLDTLSQVQLTTDGDPQIFFDNVDFAGLALSTFDGCSSDGWAHTGCNALYGVGSPLGAAEMELDAFAPSKFLGSKLQAYGGLFALDIGQNAFDVAATFGAIVLTGIDSEPCTLNSSPSSGPVPNCGSSPVP